MNEVTHILDAITEPDDDQLLALYRQLSRN